MKVEIVNPFIQAATEVLESELGGQSQRGELRLHKSAVTTDEVTAIVGVTGTVIFEWQNGTEYSELEVTHPRRGEYVRMVPGRATEAFTVEW